MKEQSTQKPNSVLACTTHRQKPSNGTNAEIWNLNFLTVDVV